MTSALKKIPRYVAIGYVTLRYDMIRYVTLQQLTKVHFECPLGLNDDEHGR